MLNKLNIYILKKFFYTFLITFLVFAVILFIGDFVEQFRKSAGKNIPLNIISNLTEIEHPIYKAPPNIALKNLPAGGF